MCATLKFFSKALVGAITSTLSVMYVFNVAVCFVRGGFDWKRWKWDWIQSDESGTRYQARRKTYKAPRGTRSEAILQRSEAHLKLQKPNTTNQTLIFERNQKPTIHIPEKIGVPVLLKVLSPRRTYTMEYMSIEFPLAKTTKHQMGVHVHARTRYKAGEEHTKVQKRGEEEPGREPRQGNRRSWITHIPHLH